MDIVALLEVLAKGLLDAENKYSGFSLVIYDFRNTMKSKGICLVLYFKIRRKRMAELQYNLIDDWEKKEVDLPALEEALEQGSSNRYSGKVFHDIAAKWKKYKKRGVSNLYLLKEAEDEGLACAYYAYSITNGVIEEAQLENLRTLCAEKLSTGEMRASASFCKASEWWDTNPTYLTKLVEKGEADRLYEYLSAQLFPQGIVLTSLSAKMNAKEELACSAIAWGLKEGGFFKKGAYMSRAIDNRYL